MLKQKFIDSCVIDVCSMSSSNAPESMRRELQLSKITYNIYLLILTGGYVPTIREVLSVGRTRHSQRIFEDSSKKGYVDKFYLPIRLILISVYIRHISHHKRLRLLTMSGLSGF